MNVARFGHERVAVRLASPGIARQHDLSTHPALCPLDPRVVCGSTMTARRPSLRAEYATPWEWFPALAVMMPLVRSCPVRCAILL